MPGFLGRKRRPEPPIEPVDREQLLARLGGAIETKAKVDPVAEERERSAASIVDHAWRRALHGDDLTG